MDIKIIKASTREIEALRIIFLKESNFQFVYNKCHMYGWADSYLYLADDYPIGYGANWDGRIKDSRDSVFEFYVRKPYRKYANLLFQQHCVITNARSVKCQSNDLLLAGMLFENTCNINAEAILFEDAFQTSLLITGVSIIRIPAEIVQNDNDCQYSLRLNDHEVAIGGFMLNYNMPYADLYYEVDEQYRQMGLGSYFIQELKKEAYRMGRVPAARCNINNSASKSALTKAGLCVCGYMLSGELKIK